MNAQTSSREEPDPKSIRIHSPLQEMDGMDDGLQPLPAVPIFPKPEIGSSAQCLHTSSASGATSSTPLSYEALASLFDIKLAPVQQELREIKKHAVVRRGHEKNDLFAEGS